MRDHAKDEDNSWTAVQWRQFGAAIDMLENALVACPEDLWSDGTPQPGNWYLVYHTLFWLDCYLSDPDEGFEPPSPFTLDEMDPSGVFPERAYTKEELQGYLRYCREKCRSRIESLADENARERPGFCRDDMSAAELLLYNMRHVQHGAAQLNLILRQNIDSAPAWVSKARD